MTQRPAMDHPVRKVLYVLPDIRRGINEAALSVQSTLDGSVPDAATYDELVQLRRDLRVAAMQVDHLTRATQDWSRTAATTEETS